MNRTDSSPRHDHVLRVSRLLAQIAVALFFAACAVAVHPALASAFPVTAVTGIPDGWSKTDVTFVLTPDYTETVETWYWLIHPSGYGPRDVYISPVTVSTEGTTGLGFFSKDTHSQHEDPLAATIRIDKTAPVSTIQGLPVGWMARGGVFGFTITATDAYSGVAASFYRLNGGAAQECSGTAFIIASDTTWIDYWSVDMAGNIEAPTTTVLRIDDGSPITTIAGLSSGWSAGDVVFTLTGESARGSIAGTYYRLGAGGTVRYGAPVTVSAEGVTTVTYNSIDDAGGMETSRTAQVRIDRSAPSSSAFGTSADWTRGTALSFSGSDTYSGLASIRYRLGGGDALVYTAPVSIASDGETNVEWWAVDRAGNAEAPHSASVKVDRSAPVSSVSGIPGTPVAGPVTLSLSATDPYSGVERIGYRLGGAAAADYTGPITVSGLGATTLTYWSVDRLGNTEAPNYAVIYISTGAPVTTISGVPSGWSAGPVTFALSATTGGLPLASTYYLTSGEANYRSYSGPVTVSAAGNTTVSYYSVDIGGAFEPVKTAAVRIDATAPHTACDARTSYAGSARVDLTPTDAHSGVAATYYRVDGGAQATGTSVFVSGVGSHSIEFWSVDNVANTELPHKTASFRITAPPVVDAVAPTTTSDALDSYVGTATIHLSATDNAGGSGVKTTYYALDGAAPVAGTTIVVSGVGSHSIEFWSVDADDNVETPRKTASFRITAPPVADTIAPITTSDALDSYVGTATIRLSATDDPGGSGVRTTYYALDGAAPVAGTTIVVSGVGSHSIEFWSVDADDNVETPRKTASFTVTPLVRPASSLSIVTSAASASLGQSFVLSGVALPTGLIGACVNVDVKKPSRTYWTYSSKRSIHSKAGAASWWYRYALKPGMARGTYLFRAVYDGDAAFLPSRSRSVAVVVR